MSGSDRHSLNLVEEGRSVYNILTWQELPWTFSFFVFIIPPYFCPLLCSIQLILCSRGFILYFSPFLLPMATHKYWDPPTSYLLVTWLLMFITFVHVNSLTQNINSIMVVVYRYCDLVSWTLSVDGKYNSRMFVSLYTSLVRPGYFFLSWFLSKERC